MCSDTGRPIKSNLLPIMLLGDACALSRSNTEWPKAIGSQAIFLLRPNFRQRIQLQCGFIGQLKCK